MWNTNAIHILKPPAHKSMARFFNNIFLCTMDMCITYCQSLLSTICVPVNADKSRCHMSNNSNNLTERYLNPSTQLKVKHKCNDNWLVPKVSTITIKKVIINTIIIIKHFIWLGYHLHYFLDKIQHTGYMVNIDACDIHILTRCAWYINYANVNMKGKPSTSTCVLSLTDHFKF